MQRVFIAFFGLLAAALIFAASAWVILSTLETSEEQEVVAILAGAFKDVQWRRARTLVWEPGSRGVDLLERDVVRTGDGSRAVIDYTAGVKLNVDPQSMVVITAPRIDETGQQVQEVLVEAGSVAGEVAGGSRRVVQIVDDTGTVAARLVSSTATGERLRYRFRRTGKGTGEVAILSGTADVETGGKRVRVDAGQSLGVGGADGGGELTALPPFPGSLEPAVDAVVALDAETRTVRIAWSPVTEAATYHLQVGRTFAFDDLAEDVSSTATEHAFAPPSRGTWYWRVSSVDAEGREGEFGFVRRFTVTRLPPPPDAAADEPPLDEPPLDEPPLDEPPLDEPPADDTADAADEQEFDFRAQVLGRGISRQRKGRGSFQSISGRTQLSAKDVLRSERNAGVRFGNGSVIGLDADSEVMLARAGSRGGRRLLALDLRSGVVLTDLAGDSASLAAVYVESKGARVTAEGTGESGVRTRTERLPGKLRIISVRGSASVAAAGASVTVPAGFAVEVPDGGPPGALIEIPAAPNIRSPQNGAQFMTLDSPPPIDFRWGPVSGAARYLLILSFDSDGTAVLYARESPDTEFTYSALPPGRYFWSVRGVSAEGIRGRPSRTQSVTVSKDTKPPPVRILAPIDGSSVAEESVKVTGKTEADAKVKINGKAVVVGSSGTFESDVRLAPGLNQIVIEAVDPANNVTFKNLKIRRE